MNVLYEVGTLIVSAAIIAILSYKLYTVGMTAENKLPSNSTQLQKIAAAIDAVISYLMDNKEFDQQLIMEIENIIQDLGALGVNVAPLTVKVGQLSELSHQGQANGS